MKTWTYEEVTAEAERQIKRGVEDAETADLQSTKNMNADFAFGAYLFWLGLTAEVATIEDQRRLEALAKSSEKRR
jgi:hypothetical protein